MTQDRTDDPMASTVFSSLCEARTRQGGRCGQIAMANGRCRFHGGLSTGPKTDVGIARQRQDVTVHGSRGAEGRELRKLVREIMARSKEIIERS